MVKKGMPQLTVLMPVWNGESFLAEAIESILGQTYGDFEFLIVDDGSTDKTLAIIQRYRDSRIRLYRMNHGGIVQALNFGLKQASTRWVARMDADDVSMPDRLEQQWMAVLRNPRAVLCYTDVEEFGAGHHLGKRARSPRSRAFMALTLCRWCPISHSTVLFHKQTAIESGSYQANERHAEDFGLWGRMLLAGDFIYIPRKLVRLRKHDSSISFSHQHIQRELTGRLCLKHVESFMRLENSDARKACRILQKNPLGHEQGGWFWLVLICLTRLRWQSPELWAWILKETLKRISPFRQHS
jgi:glycosyltransferase involved in cell wall biosynthesis